MNRRKGKKAENRFEALMAQSAKTRALDRLDVREGRLSSQALSWFSEEYAQSLTLTVPDYSSLVIKDAMEWPDSIPALPNETEEDAVRPIASPR